MTEPQQQQEQESAAARLQGLLQRHNNDAMATVQTLLAENYEMRGKLRDIKAKVPGADARVLSASEAAAYDALIALGTPDTLKQTLEQAKTATEELQSYKRKEQVRAAAQIAEYDAAALADVLTLAGNPELVVSGDGDKRTVGVKVEGQTLPLKDFITSRYPHFLKSLTGEERTEPRKREPRDIDAQQRGRVLTREERIQAQAEELRRKGGSYGL